MKPYKVAVDIGLPEAVTVLVFGKSLAGAVSAASQAVEQTEKGAKIVGLTVTAVDFKSLGFKLTVIEP